MGGTYSKLRGEIKGRQRHEVGPQSLRLSYIHPTGMSLTMNLMTLFSSPAPTSHRRREWEVGCGGGGLGNVPGCGLGEPLPPRRPRPLPVLSRQPVVLSWLPEMAPEQAGPGGKTLPHAHPGCDGQPLRAPSRRSTPSAENQPSMPPKGEHAPSETVLPPSQLEATLSVLLEQLNIYIDVALPALSAPCRVVVPFVCSCLDSPE